MLITVKLTTDTKNTKLFPTK